MVRNPASGAFKDLLVTVDSGLSVLLVCLDSISVLDSVDHSILWSRVRHAGLKETWLKLWMDKRRMDRQVN